MSLTYVIELQDKNCFVGFALKIVFGLFYSSVWKLIFVSFLWKNILCRVPQDNQNIVGGK